MFVIKLTYIAKKIVFNYSIINFVGPFLVLSVRETGKKVFSKKKSISQNNYNNLILEL